MTQFFIGLYDYFERHKILFYLSLISCVLLMGFFALQVRFEENITQFFPDTKDSQNTIKVFDNLKIKDKIIIMLSSADTCHRVEPDSLIEAAGQLQQTLTEKAGGKLIKGIFAQVDQSLIQGATDFVYEHLPLFLTDTDYQRFDSLLTDKGIQAVIRQEVFFGKTCGNIQMGVFHEDETNSAVGFRICYNRNKSAIFIRFPGNDFSVGIYGAFTAGSQCQQAKK